MYKNLNASALGITGRQSELIEAALTGDFQGLDLDANELLSRAKSQGIDQAIRCVQSANIKLGGWFPDLKLAANDATFEANLVELDSLAETAAAAGFTYCQANLDPGSDDLPYHENFERTRQRLAQVGETLGKHGIRLGIGLQAAPEVRKDRPYQFIHKVDELLLLLKAITSDNVGLALDTWNWKVGGGSVDQLRDLDVQQLVCVALADVPADADLETIEACQRVLPDDESLDEVASLVGHLAEQGYEGPITLFPHASQVVTKHRMANASEYANLLRRIWKAANLDKSGRPVAENAAS